MSSEVCPFCGKTYKRLKTHLPHCKAAASSKTFPNKEDVVANLTSSSLLASVSPKTKGKGKKSAATTDLKAEKSREGTVSSYQQPKAALSSVSSSTKRKKQADQIKDAEHVLSPPLSLTVSKPKKKSLRDLLEAAKLEQVTKGSQDTETIDNSDEVSTKNARLTLLSADSKPKDAPKKKGSKTKKALPTTKNTSDFSDSKVHGSSTIPRVKGNFWDDSEGEVENPSVNQLFLKTGSGQQGKVTLQDVKATLGRANTRKSSILSQIEAANNLGSKVGLDSGFSAIPFAVENQKEADGCSVPSDDLLSSTSQQTEAKSAQKKSKQTSLISLQNDAAPKLEPASASASLPSVMGLPQAWQAAPTPGTVSFNNKGLTVDHHTGLLSVSPPLHQVSSPLQLPPAKSLPTRAEELQQKIAEKLREGALTQQSVGQVRLRELPEWMASRTPSHPRDVVEMVQRGWRWYYRKYIDVKKGGVGGLGMLLVGYCVMSYIWGYPHIKLSRWRKYH